MNIAIIGSSSFLGKRIAESFSQSNTELKLFSRKRPHTSAPAQWIEYNFPDKRLNYDELAKNDVIYYCAGAGIQPGNKDSKSLIEELNFHEPVRLINNLKEKKFKGKLVTFGSYFEIGNSNKEHCYSEDELINHNNELINDYSRTKHQLTKFISNLFKTEKPSFILQHFILTNFYGYSENENRLIPYIVKSALNGEKLKFTSGSQMRQFTHIKDIVSFLRQNHSNTQIGIFNLTDTAVISVKELIHLALELIKEKMNITSLAEFGTASKSDILMKYLALDASMLNKYFNFHPAISLKEGINEYILNYGADQKNIK